MREAPRVDALEEYRKRLSVLREAYHHDLLAIECDTAERINQWCRRVPPIVLQLPTFRNLVERWTECDPSTKLGREHRERADARYLQFASDALAIRMELGL